MNPFFAFPASLKLRRNLTGDFFQDYITIGDQMDKYSYVTVNPLFQQQKHKIEKIKAVKCCNN